MLGHSKGLGRPFEKKQHLYLLRKMIIAEPDAFACRLKRSFLAIPPYRHTAIPPYHYLGIQPQRYFAILCGKSPIFGLDYAEQLPIYT